MVYKNFSPKDIEILEEKSCKDEKLTENEAN